MTKTVKVASVDELPPGRGKVVELEDKKIALFNVDGSFYAIDNVCLHKGGPLGEGELKGKIVTCPWHQWQYDVTTGMNTFDSNLRVKTYSVEVSGRDILVEIL